MESIPSPKALGKANQAPDLSPSLDSLVPTFGVWRGSAGFQQLSHLRKQPDFPGQVLKHGLLPPDLSLKL